MLSELNVGDRVDESDFSTICPSGHFVQLEYVEEEETKVTPYEVKPGIWTIQKTMAGLVLVPTSFVNDDILSDFVHTETITGQIDKFFSRIDVYKKHKIEVPKRGWLLYGKPGCGKSTIINKVTKTYSLDNETAIIVWDTSKYEAYQIKDFIKSFEYKGAKKLILVVEDIGGVEIDQVRMKSDSSLLSLLDNVEKTFIIPVAIIATTNHPEIFLGNLTNRPQRFDTKIEVPPPNGEQRAAFLRFFSSNTAGDDILTLIKDKKFEDLTPAHIKEVLIRSEIYDLTLKESLDQIMVELNQFKKDFQTNKKSIGFGSYD